MVQNLLAGVMLLLGSITDIRSREVPYKISIGGMLVAFCLAVFLSFKTNSILPVFSCLLGGVVLAIPAFIMYFTGQWGGGDTLVACALGLFVGYNRNLLYFGIVLLFASAISGMLFAIYKIITMPKRFLKNYAVVSKQYRVVKLVFFGIVLVLNLVLVPVFYALIAWFCIVIVVQSCLIVLSVQNSCLDKLISAKMVSEGDWLVKPVKVGKLIIPPRKTGLSQKEVDLIKSSGIKTVLVKDGLPFIPVMFIAFIIAMYIL